MRPIIANPTLPEPLLLPREAAAFLRVHVVTLSNWRGQCRGPKAVFVGGHVRYRASNLNAWLDAPQELETREAARG